MTYAIAGVLLLVGLVLMAARPRLLLVILMTTSTVKLWVMYNLGAFVDYTLAVCVMTMLFGLWSVLRQPTRAHLALPLVPAAAMAGLALWMWASLVWTDAPSYGFQKTLHFTFIGIPFFLAPHFLIRTRPDAVSVVKMLMLTGLVVSVTALIAPLPEVAQLVYYHGFERATFLGGSPQVMGEMAVFGILAGLVLLLVGGLTRGWRVLALVVLPVCALALITSGSRACLLGFIGTAVLLPFLVRHRRRWLLAPLMAVVVAGLILGLVMLFPARVPLNIRLFSETGLGAQVAHSRGMLWWWALENAPAGMPFGHGAGSFAVDWFGQDTAIWPHNILIEAIYELGLVGAICMVVLLAVAGWQTLAHVRRATGTIERLVIAAPAATVLFMYVTVMVDPDINGARLLYLMMGVVFAVAGAVRAPVGAPETDLGEMLGVPLYREIAEAPTAHDAAR